MFKAKSPKNINSFLIVFSFIATTTILAAFGMAGIAFFWENNLTSTQQEVFSVLKMTASSGFAVAIGLLGGKAI